MGYFEDANAAHFDYGTDNVETALGKKPEELGLPASLTDII